MERTSRAQSGQSLVEFALVLPFFILFVMGTIDLGRLIYSYSALHNAVREGARFGVVSPDSKTGIISVVQDTSVGLDNSKLAVSVTSTTSGVSTILNINAAYDFPMATPVLKAITGSNTLKLSAQSTMRVEG